MISAIAINKTESSLYLYFSEFKERQREIVLEVTSCHNIIRFVNFDFTFYGKFIISLL